MGNFIGLMLLLLMILIGIYYNQQSGKKKTLRKKQPKKKKLPPNKQAISPHTIDDMINYHAQEFHRLNQMRQQAPPPKAKKGWW